jgi:hypothetical protein
MDLVPPVIFSTLLLQGTSVSRVRESKKIISGIGPSLRGGTLYFLKYNDDFVKALFFLITTYSSVYGLTGGVGPVTLPLYSIEDNET